LQLTPEQAGIAQACGCQIVPATEEQIWRLSREHRIFRLDGGAVLVRRPDGFLETAGTLRLLLEQHAHAQDLAGAAPVLPPAPSLGPPPASSVSAPVAPGPESPPFRDAGPGRAPPRRAPRGESGGMRRDLPPDPLSPDSPDRPPAMPEAPAGPPGEPAGNSAGTSLGTSPGDIARPAPATDAPAPAGAAMAGRAPRAESGEEPGGGPWGPRPEPAVPIAESVTPGYLVCLEDGRQVKMLTRHLKAAYGMTPDQYRARWGLPPDYPMVAPDSAERRAAARVPRAAGRGRAGGAEEEAVEE